MDRFIGRDLALDSVEKADELLMSVALHAASDDLALKHIEGGKQGCGAVALVIVGIVAQRPFFIGSPGWVRSRAWIWLFSSMLRTTA